MALPASVKTYSQVGVLQLHTWITDTVIKRTTNQNLRYTRRFVSSTFNVFNLEFRIYNSKDWGNMPSV